VSTICRYSSRVVTFLQAVMRPKFRGPGSVSIARSLVWLHLPINNNNNNNNNNNQVNVYGAVIMAEPLREFTRFI